MTRSARWFVWLIAVAEIPPQILLYRHYRNTVDGQPELANVAIFVYGLMAILAVWLVDRLIYRLRRR